MTTFLQLSIIIFYSLLIMQNSDSKLSYFKYKHECWKLILFLEGSDSVGAYKTDLCLIFSESELSCHRALSIVLSQVVLVFKPVSPSPLTSPLFYFTPTPSHCWDGLVFARP